MIREPKDTHLREALVESQQVYKGRFLDVRCDRVRLPNGLIAEREYIVHPGAVMVVPVLDDGRLVVERQFRYPLGSVLLEFPAGKLDAAEAPLSCGIRELQEETGYTAKEWARAGILHNAIAYSTEGIEVWFARCLSLGERRLDDGEFLDVSTATVAELNLSARRGGITDAKTLIGLNWFQLWLAGEWDVTWLAVDKAAAMQATS